ncbi:MAG: hypothetical protein PF795_06725 [Kiritimatiellae bacterium]|jgi:hypothetical protein|nr:hypothetical protein [Kiritimatiellia bacterium]
MILTLITLKSPQQASSLAPFEEVARSRYHRYLSQEFTVYAPGVWYTAVKPYHSGIFPFLVMDLHILLRGITCNVFFGHDLLPYNAVEHERILLTGPLTQEIERIRHKTPATKSHMRFQGFGNRVDIGLNALSTLYVDMLSSLTRVECDVLTHLREYQYTLYNDPTSIRTFGLQKKVADTLDKSPVALHHSLRSSKYLLLAETATAMKEMMV